MTDEPIYRHEYKYLISDAQAAMLRARLRGLLTPDPHGGEGGSYNICSLYFDDMFNSCYYENENGTDPREKFRIRIYNRSADRITLECKRKERGMTLKTACPLTEAETRLLMRGELLPISEDQPPVKKKLLLAMHQKRLRPVVIVDYSRIPLICRQGNVRITLDSNICSSGNAEGFLSSDFAKRPVLPTGQQLLEVKYDSFLPDVIYRALMLESLQQTAFSKFYICRKYTIKG